jgi:hypothetical protein
MLRALVVLLAAVGTATSDLVAYVHGGSAWLAVGGAVTAAGLLAYVTAPPQKNLRGLLAGNFPGRAVARRQPSSRLGAYAQRVSGFFCPSDRVPSAGGPPGWLLQARSPGCVAVGSASVRVRG